MVSTISKSSSLLKRQNATRQNAAATIARNIGITIATTTNRETSTAVDIDMGTARMMTTDTSDDDGHATEMTSGDQNTAIGIATATATATAATDIGGEAPTLTSPPASKQKRKQRPRYGIHG